jgi:peptidoglycan/LPS O-acetylase OafA/YrhL
MDAVLKTRYRPDIDGLRAVAIIPVLLFHVGIKGFSGGFVGVDVFFVISGFLITTIIRSALEQDRFSVLLFYERRIRRIVPPLFVMALACSILSFVISSPEALRHFGKALLAATLFSSNMFFWSETNYFEQSLHESPLLHSWSLAVEEQFYIVFPILLYLLYRYLGRNSGKVLGALMVASFAAAVWMTTHAPSLAFYAAPLRGWELLLGAVLAFDLVPPLTGRPVAEIAAGLGALLIAWSVHVYGGSTPFPGLAALAPAGGAALIIHSGGTEGTLVGRALRWPWMVGIGLISYPLYLWHWPVIIFAKDLMGAELRLRYALACIGLSLVLAVLSWLIVERPIRERRVLASQHALFGAAALCLVVAGLTGALLAVSRGAAWRYPASARRIMAYEGYDVGALWRYGTCFITPEAPHFRANVCLRIDASRPNFLLMGDSHAAHYWYGLTKAFPEVNVLQANASGCRPVIGGSVQHHEGCRQMRRYLIEEFLPRHRMDAVILAASWYNDDTDLKYLPHTLALIKRHAGKVYLVGPITLYDSPLPGLLANDLRFGIATTDRHRLKKIAALDAKMEAIAQANGVTYVSAYRSLCPDATCETLAAPGVPVQWDDGHLTADGSVLLSRKWRDEGVMSVPISWRAP